MSTYQATSRKYRPQRFEDMQGQAPIIQVLKNSIKMGKAAQAYLFCGTRGTGKTTLARIFAKALNCPNKTDDFEPCNTCESCKEITRGASLEVLEIDGASNRGIDDIRSLNETVGYAPTKGSYKIYIIDEVHMLTKEAFNALLKTLEEPPPHVKFFFATTEPHKVLPTILSRCQRFDLNRLESNEIITKLKDIAKKENLSIEDEALLLLSKKAEGSLRDAESLLDQLICFGEKPITCTSIENALGITPQEHFINLNKAVLNGDISFAFTLSNTLFSSGKNLNFFLEDLTKNIQIDLKKAILEMPSTFTKQESLEILEYLTDWLLKLQNQSVTKLHLEMILLFILRIKSKVSIESLIERLLYLENRVTSSNQGNHRAQATQVGQTTQVDKVAQKTQPTQATQEIQSTQMTQANQETHKSEHPIAFDKPSTITNSATTKTHSTTTLPLTSNTLPTSSNNTDSSPAKPLDKITEGQLKETPNKTPIAAPIETLKPASTSTSIKDAVSTQIPITPQESANTETPKPNLQTPEQRSPLTQLDLTQLQVENVATETPLQSLGSPANPTQTTPSNQITQNASSSQNTTSAQTALLEKEQKTTSEQATATIAKPTGIKEKIDKSSPEYIQKIAKQETIMRFASVELNGVVKKA